MNNLIHTLNGQPAISSITIANEFGRRHDNVLRTLDSLISDGTLAGLEFEVSEYKDKSGKNSKYYELYEEGFLIAMPFIGGKKARQGQRRLVKAFIGLRKKSLGWHRARIEGIDARRNETDTIKDFVEYAMSQGSKSAAMYYANITKMTYKSLFFSEGGVKLPKQLREFLDAQQLSFLTTAEYVCTKALRDGMEMKLPYKDIYKLSKQRMEKYAETVGSTPLLSDLSNN
jgi:Rha family phage regulatory protein